VFSGDLDQEELIQRLVETLPCSACGGAYGPEDVHVIEQQVDTWTLAALCPECGAESVIKAYIDIVDDDPLDEELAPPDTAEVAAWRQFLADFHGDLRDLLYYRADGG